MVSALDERFNRVIREALTEPLAPHGFRKRGRVFRRRLDELAWVIDVQRSRYNSREELQFTVNCGIYVPRVLSTYLRLSEPTFPTSVDCCISVRIGMLADDQLDKWWALCEQPQSATEDMQIVGDVRERIILRVLPFLERFPSTLEVADYLERPRPLHEGQAFPYTEAMALGSAGIVRMIRGEWEAARDALARAVKKASRTPAEEHLRSLERSLLSSDLRA